MKAEEGEQKKVSQPKKISEEVIEKLEEFGVLTRDLEAKNDKHKDFISIAAHELRSPIMPILGTLELIEYEFDEKIKQKLR